MISKLFCKQRGMPYAQAELARLNKEDEEASGDDEKEEEALATQCIGLAGAVANKLAVMESINPNFFPDRRLWKWIVAALADQTIKKKKDESIGSVTTFLEEQKKKAAKEEPNENGKSRKKARRE